MLYHCGNIEAWSDASVELGRLHALCDVLCDYARNELGPSEAEGNIAFGVEAIHDFVVFLEKQFENLSGKEYGK